MAKGFKPSKSTLSPANMGRAAKGRGVGAKSSGLTGSKHTTNRTKTRVGLGGQGKSATPLPLNAKGPGGSLVKGPSRRQPNVGTRPGDK